MLKLGAVILLYVIGTWKDARPVCTEVNLVHICRIIFVLRLQSLQPMHLQLCPTKVVPPCCWWLQRTIPFVSFFHHIKTKSQTLSLQHYTAVTSSIPWGSSGNQHRVLEQISAHGVVVMMKMRIFVGWCWNKDCETPEFLTRKSCAGVSEKSPLWLHHHLEAEWPKWGGLSDFSAFHPRPPLPLDTGFKTEVGTLEKYAVRHFGAA